MKKTLFCIVISIMMFVCVNAGYSKDIIFNKTDIISQSEFEEFVKELGMGLYFAPMSPAEPLGLLGFDISAEILASSISKDNGSWQKMMEEPFNYIFVPRIHAQKGLPFNIDVGAMYLKVPNSNIGLWGVEVKYALFEGGILTPAVSVRGTYSKLTGVDELDASTQSLELIASKGVLFLTPYAGISMVKTNGSDNVDDSIINLEELNETVLRYFAGVQFSPLPLMIINFEAGYGDIAQFGLKLGLRF